MTDRTGVVLADDVDEVRAPDPWVALLPALDPTTMGWKHRDFLLGPHRAELFDVNGNGGPTVWADGRIVGGWAHRDDGEVAFEIFDDIGARGDRADRGEGRRPADDVGRCPPQGPRPRVDALGEATARLTPARHTQGMSLLDSWTLSEHTADGATHPTYRKGTGPGVIVIHEIPGLTPDVIGFGEEVVAAGYTVVMPHLFGTPGGRAGPGVAREVVPPGVRESGSSPSWRPARPPRSPGGCAACRASCTPSWEGPASAPSACASPVGSRSP